MAYSRNVSIGERHMRLKYPKGILVRMTSDRVVVESVGLRAFVVRLLGWVGRRLI